MNDKILTRWFCWLVLYEIPDETALRNLRIIIRVLAGRNRLISVNQKQAVLCVFSYDQEGIRDGLNHAASMTNIKILAMSFRHSHNHPEAD